MHAARLCAWTTTLAVAAGSLFTGAAAGAAQGPDTADVTGVVGDVETGSPIPVAVVELPELGRMTTTNADGRFVFLGIPEGNHTLRITAMGYAAWEQETDLRHLDLLRIGLLPQPIALENIRVSADRLQKRRRTAAVSVTAVQRRELLRAPEATAAEVIRSRLPFPRQCPDSAGLASGAGIVAGTVFGAAGDPLELCIWSRGTIVRPNVFIDDRPVPSALLWTYNTSELYAVELYAGGREIRVYTVAFMESGLPILPRLPGWQ